MSDVSADIKEFVADIDNRITQLKAENEKLKMDRIKLVDLIKHAYDGYVNHNRFPLEIMEMVIDKIKDGEFRKEYERLREIEEAAKNAGIDDMILVVKFMRDNFDHNSENLKVIFNALRRLAKLKHLLEKK